VPLAPMELAPLPSGAESSLPSGAESL